MADVVWPAALPQSCLVRKSRNSPEPGVIRSSVDVGPAKVRRRAAIVIQRFSLGISVNRTQLALFRTFFHSSCKNGSEIFEWVDHFTGADCEYRFVGEYSVVPLTPRAADSSDRYEIDFELEQLPTAPALPPVDPAAPGDPQTPSIEDDADEPGAPGEGEGGSIGGGISGLVIAPFDPLPNPLPGVDEPPVVVVLEDVGDDAGAGALMGADSGSSGGSSGGTHFVTGGGEENSIPKGPGAEL